MKLFMIIFKSTLGYLAINFSVTIKHTILIITITKTQTGIFSLQILFTFLFLKFILKIILFPLHYHYKHFFFTSQHLVFLQ